MNFGLNEVKIIGNVTRDAVLENVNIEGKPTPRCRFTVAVNCARGKSSEDPQYFEVHAWREYAQKVAPWLLKGRKVHVSGHIVLRQYHDAQKVRHSVLQIVDPTIGFLDKQPQDDKLEELTDNDLPFEPAE